MVLNLFIMKNEKKVHPLGILIIAPFVIFIIWVFYQVLAEGLMNIYNPWNILN